MQTQPMDNFDPIVRRLRTIEQELPDLSDAARIYKAILPLLRDADLHIGAVSLTPEQVRENMEKGRPLLSGLDLDLDAAAVHGLMIKLAAAVETAGGRKQPHMCPLLPRTSGELDSAARRIRLALEENRLDPSALLPHIASDERGPVTSAAQSLGLDPDLLWTLAKNALKPALRAWCRQLTPMARGIPWHKDTCFVCGAEATLGELQDNGQAKHLRCGSCGADWPFRRLQCTRCGSEDHKTQQYLYDERNREKMRVEVCDTCKGYLKVIAAFTPTPPEMLTVEDLATLHMDYIAQERGYARSGVQCRSRTA